MAIPSRPTRSPANNKVLTAPEWLSEGSKVVFKELAESLATLRIADETDVHSLAVLSDALNDFRVAVALIDAEGELVKGRDSSMVKNPAYTLKNQAWQRINPLLASFGLTPSAKSSLGISSTEDKSEDLLGSILSGIPSGDPAGYPAKPH